MEFNQNYLFGAGVALVIVVVAILFMRKGKKNKKNETFVPNSTRRSYINADGEKVNKHKNESSCSDNKMCRSDNCKEKLCKQGDKIKKFNEEVSCEFDEECKSKKCERRYLDRDPNNKICKW